MSKSTKVIAALGVVAGLGVAALPAMTYAISTDGAVKLEVEIEPAIAISIESSPTSSTVATSTGVYYNSTPAGAQANWNITGTPYAAKDGTTNLFTNWSSAKVSMTQNSANRDMQSIVKVYTNNAGGYDLNLADEDSDNSLRLDASNEIPAISAAGAISGGTAAWGYHLVGASETIDGNTSYSPVPISTGTAATVGTQAAPSASTGDTYTVNYGVATAAVQATGTYSDVIVYTATTK